MYLVGVWFAAYYDWWVRRTYTRPRWWAIGIGVAQVPLMYVLSFVPPIWIVFLYPLFVVALVPAFFAATKNEGLQADERAASWEKTRRIHKLIERGDWHQK